ncbi:hypothetical protein BX616_009709 [Lobosporangium transversale]|nr:hypothetical protein BX616_009709 [Lobosporangium transversale]
MSELRKEIMTGARTGAQTGMGTETGVEIEANTVNSIQPLKQYALYIPEIVSMIVSHLEPTDILFCRGVCQDWRRIFSPFLKLHAIYCNYGLHTYKTRFEAHLETLGMYIQSLKQVYPDQPDLERIQRTCPNLKHLGLFLRAKSKLDKQVIIKFFQTMAQLERIDLFSHRDHLVSELLSLLVSSYQLASQASVVSSNPNSMTSPTALRILDIGNAAHSLTFPSMEWGSLENVMKTHSHLKELILREAFIWERSKTEKIRSNSLLTRALIRAPLSRLWGHSDLQTPGTGCIEDEDEDEDYDYDHDYYEYNHGHTHDHDYHDDNNDSCVDRPTKSSRFNHLERLVFDNIKLSEKLLVSIMRRCPALKTLNLKLTGVNLPKNIWAQFLPNCPQLMAISVDNEYAGIEVDVPHVWVLAPSLKYFRLSRSHGAHVYFHSPVEVAKTIQGLPPVQINRSTISPLHPPGSTLVSLELEIRLPISDLGLRYVMTNCHSLEKLILGIQYFTDWTPATINDNGGEVGHADDSFSTLSQAEFPPWACGRTLKRLELNATYMPYDHRFDSQTHAFMRRLEDLLVLETLVLPAKLLSDLSESLNPDYAAFRSILDQLDHRLMLQDQSHVQSIAFKLPSPSLSNTPSNPSSFSSCMESLYGLHPSKGQIQQLWDRGMCSPKNFIPHIPSVREVSLTSPGSFRFSMEMRYLHILMEALPGLEVIWTQTGLYEIDCIRRFRQTFNQFKEFYGFTGVQLNLGDI